MYWQRDIFMYMKFKYYSMRIIWHICIVFTRLYKQIRLKIALG